MNELIDQKNKVSVENIRKKFLIESETNPQLYHRIDIERVGSEDWQIERFILDTSTEEDAFKALVRAMQWKQSFCLHERNDSYFPKEFFLIFGHEKYSRDREGRLAIWVAHKNYRKISELSLLFQHFLGHQIEKLDRKAGNKGWISINDCSGAGLGNVDMTLAKFRIELLNYYPKGMKIGFNVDMPWILGPVFKIIKNFMNKNIRDHVILINRKQILDYIDINSVPVTFGGKRECNFEVIKDLLPLNQLKYLDLTDKQIDTFYNTYKLEKH